MKFQIKNTKGSLQRNRFFLIIMFVCLLHLTTQVDDLSESTMKRIFNNNQYIVIYVCEEPNTQVYQIFAHYCEEHPCAYLDKQNSLYENIRGFVGHPSKQYFLILDAPRQLKYIKLIDNDQELKYKDIYNFEADFTSSKLKPYYSSQEEPEQVYEPCRKLVGKNFDNFLALKAPIKVVYLYTEQPSCAICGQMLRGFADIAEKIYRDDVITFGYFQIYKNDHPQIPSEIAPYFLIFKEGEEQPRAIEGQKFPQLQTALVNIIAEHIYPEYGRRHEHEHDEINAEDLVEVKIDPNQVQQIPSKDELFGNNLEL